MSLVTIDDKITRIREHSVSIEIVERVERHIFYTAGSSVPLEHGDENSRWLRGQYLLDSDEVKAARSAMVLSEENTLDEILSPLGPRTAPPIPQAAPQGVQWSRLVDVNDLQARKRALFGGK